MVTSFERLLITFECVEGLTNLRTFIQTVRDERLAKPFERLEDCSLSVPCSLLNGHGNSRVKAVGATTGQSKHVFIQFQFNN